MRRRTLFGIAGAVLVIVLGLLVSYQTLYAPTIARKVLLETEETSPFETTYVSTYTKGAYSITGTVLLPNRCHRVVATSAIEDTMVRVDVSIPSDEGICLEIPVQAPFETVVEGEEGKEVKVFVNNTEVPAP